MAVGGAGRDLERALAAPRQRGEARIVAAADLHRQVMPRADSAATAAGTSSARRAAISAVPAAASTISANSFDALRRRQLPARRDDAARMLREPLRDGGAARRLVAGDAERAADRGEDGVARAHCASHPPLPLRLEGLPSGAGKSRCRVQPPASGSQRKRPRACPSRPSANTRQRHRDRVELRPRREEGPDAEARSAPSRARDAARIRARASAASASAAGCAPGRLPRSARRRSRRSADAPAFSMPTMLGVSTAPIGPG